MHLQVKFIIFNCNKKSALLSNILYSALLFLVSQNSIESLRNSIVAAKTLHETYLIE